MEKPKSIKVMTISILVIAMLGILNFIPNLFLLFISPEIVVSKYTQLGLNPSISIFQGILSFLLQLSALISTIMILQYKGWGRKLLCITTGLMVMSAISNIILSLVQSVGFVVIAVISNLFVIGFYGYSWCYFNRNKVKTYFN